MEFICDFCGNAFIRKPCQIRYKRKFCNRACSTAFQTRKKRKNDASIKSLYRGVSVNGKKVGEHRVVMEKILGRKLLRNEIVHHIDGNGLNNTPENLRVCSSQGGHARDHLSRDIIQFPDSKLLSLWNSGKSTGDIAAFFNCSIDIVRRRLKRLGIRDWAYRRSANTPYPNTLKWDIGLAIDLFNLGFNYSQIGKKIGVHRGTVQGALDCRGFRR
ncbi:MAG: HNH endonuclease [Candidatus Margulisiibacteriota bacterium]